MIDTRWSVLVGLALLVGCNAEPRSVETAQEERRTADTQADRKMPVRSDEAVISAPAAVRSDAVASAAADAAAVDSAHAVVATETPNLDAQLEAEQEQLKLAAAMARAMHEKDERDRLAGKSFNESNIGWSFACDRSAHGIAILAGKVSGLTYDEKSNICSCVKSEAPYSVELLLESSSRSLEEAGADALNDQVSAFDRCYSRTMAIRTQRSERAAAQRVDELQELKALQDANSGAAQE